MFSFVRWVCLSSIQHSLPPAYIPGKIFSSDTEIQTFTNLEFTGNVAASPVDNYLLLAVVKVGLVQHLMMVELLHGLTERDGVRTPDRSTPHPPRLACLQALQEVVVLLLLAGLGRR